MILAIILVGLIATLILIRKRKVFLIIGSILAFFVLCCESVLIFYGYEFDRNIKNYQDETIKYVSYIKVLEKYFPDDKEEIAKRIKEAKEYEATIDNYNNLLFRFWIEDRSECYVSTYIRFSDYEV